MYFHLWDIPQPRFRCKLTCIFTCGISHSHGSGVKSTVCLVWGYRHGYCAGTIATAMVSAIATAMVSAMGYSHDCYVDYGL